jgi:hypothetical protein
VDDIPIQAVPQVKEGEIDDAAHERLLPELEYAPNGHGDHDPHEDPGERLKGIFGYESRAVPCTHLVEVQLRRERSEIALQLALPRQHFAHPLIAEAAERLIFQVFEIAIDAIVFRFECCQVVLGLFDQLSKPRLQILLFDASV